jgi:hypothetical protein
MSDAREKQPRFKTVDLTSQGKGDRFYAVIRTSPYSSIKSEVVYPHTLTVVFRVPDFDGAVQFAKAIATIIELAHDVHRSIVQEVGKARLPENMPPHQRPMVGA